MTGRALSLSAALACALSLTAGAPARAASWLELNFYLSGPRYEGVLPAVPTNVRLRLYARDIGMCCVDACNYPPALEDVLLNGTKLTRVVTEGLPDGVTAALEFSVDGSGAVRQ